MKLLLLTASLLASITLTHAQVIQPDMTFGQNGIVKTNILGKGNVLSEVARKTIVLPDQKLLWVIEVGTYTVLSRRLPNGDVDPSYGENGYSEPVKLHRPNAVRQSDGKVIVVGASEYSNSDFVVARFKEQGFLDLSFGKNGVTLTDIGTYNDSPTDVALQSDGKIIVTGHYYPDGPSPNGSFPKAIALRYSPNGSLDATFATGGKLYFKEITTVHGLAVRSDDKIVFGGSNNINGQMSNHLTLYRADGFPDDEFGFGGQWSINHDVRSLLIQPDGRIVVGGGINNGINNVFAVSRFTENGLPDYSFNNTGTITTDFGANMDHLNAISLDSKGRITASGYSRINGKASFAVARYTSKGYLDDAFDEDGKKLIPLGPYDDFANSVIIQNDNKIVLTGFSYVGNGYDFSFVRLNEDGSFDDFFDEDGKLTGHLPALNGNNDKLLQLSLGKLLVLHSGFDGTTFNRYLVRYLPNGTLDKTYGDNGALVLQSYHFTVQPDGKILATGTSFYNYRVNVTVTRYNEDGTVDLNFAKNGVASADLGSDANPSDIVLQQDGKILVLGDVYKENQRDVAVIRFNPDGSLDKSFGNYGHQLIDLNNDVASKLVIQEDGKLVILGFSYTSDNKYDFFLHRLANNGIPDATFGNNGVVIGNFSSFDFGKSVIVQPDGKLLVFAMRERSSFDYVNFLIRYNANGEIDHSFGMKGIVEEDEGEVLGINVQPNGKILTAGVVKDGNTFNAFIGRLNQDGSQDLTLGTGGKIINAVSSGDDYFTQLLLSNNMLYVLGSSFYVNNSGLLAAYTMNENSDITIWYRDFDGDGFGDPKKSITASSQPAGYVANKEDCNDYRVHYQDRDNDGWGNNTKVPCGTITRTGDCDDGDAKIHSVQTFYRDADGDSYGDAGNKILECTNTPPPGYVRNSIDCNDNDKGVYWPKTYYRDADGDGLGDPNNKLNVCSSTTPTGYVSNSRDTNDTPLVVMTKTSDTHHKTVQEAMILLDGFSLVAYPNPLAKSTRIQFNVPVDAAVRIQIFDVMGREVGLVFSGNRSAGTHYTDYNASKLSSGVYFCRMVAVVKGKETLQTIKMVRAE
jgi:uncharacterized delta-60 repeat protein